MGVLRQLLYQLRQWLEAKSMASIFLLIFLSGSLLPATFPTPIGINYGQIANNLPSPKNVITILQSIGVNKVKLYDADPRVLRAFSNTGVEFIVGLDNEQLARMGDLSNIVAWVKTNVQTYLSETKITCVTVGNEVVTGDDKVLIRNLLPTMRNVQAALVTLGLDKQASITTGHLLAVLLTSYPPSAGSFQSDLTDVISPIMSFQSKIGLTFLINAYPFFAYKGNLKQLPLDFVLFQQNQWVLDPISNLRYDNMLFPQIDVIYSTLAELGYSRLPVQLSETGWPSKGDEDEVGATPENARKYNGSHRFCFSYCRETMGFWACCERDSGFCVGRIYKKAWFCVGPICKRVSTNFLD